MDRSFKRRPVYIFSILNLMKKLFKKIFILFIIVFVCDRVGAFFLENIFYKQKHGDDAATIYLLDSTKADILVFGSSRASHHYVSDIFEKKLNTVFFNGGRDKMGLHYSFAILEVLLKRHKPKVILFDLMPTSLFKINNEEEIKKYNDIQTNTLLPFANAHPGIYNTIDELNKIEKYKSKICKTYNYNSLFGTIIQNAYTNLGHTSIKGYEPVYGSIDKKSYSKPLFPFPATDNAIDTTAIEILNRCVNICVQNDVKPIILISPFYFEIPVYKNLEIALKEIAKNTTVYDFSRDSFYVKNNNLFYDEWHLNHTGASLFF
ncbi:MAG: hypothetical protein QM763_05035 [Agriterribacter sp.]